MYLNRFDFLNNAVGIKTAANVYFNKEPADLNVQESAMLVGMLKNPSLFQPTTPSRTNEGTPQRGAGADGEGGQTASRRGGGIQATPLGT